MLRIERRIWTGIVAGSAMVGPAVAMGEELEMEVSGAAGMELASHFMLYGQDVWAQGGNWSRPSVFTFGEVTFDFGLFDFTAGAWTEARDNADTWVGDNRLGGPITELDLYTNVGFDVDRFRFDIGYEAWLYDAQAEEVLPASVGFDDSDLIVEGFAFNPSIATNTRLSGGPGTSGTVIVLGIEPGMRVLESETFPLDLSLPIEGGFGTGNYYGKSGYAYTSIGATLAAPLLMMPEGLGEWEVYGNLSYHFTEPHLGNPRRDFPTGVVGLEMGF